VLNNCADHRYLKPCQLCINLHGLQMRYLLLSFMFTLLLVPGAHSQVQNPPAQTDSVKKLRVRDIFIDGNKVTRSSVIRRELNIKVGDVVEADSVNGIIEENKLRLFNLQLFNEVDQRTERSGSMIDWYITVKERWYIIPGFIFQFADHNFNTWWVEKDHDLHRVSEGITLTDKNFRGNLETLSASIQTGYTQKLALNYIRPYVNNGQTNGLGFSFSMAQSTQAYYATDSDKPLYVGGYSGPVILRQASGGISYIYRPAYASRHIFRLSYKDYSVADTVLKLNPDYYANRSDRARFLEFFYRYELNKVDNWNYPLKGFKLVAIGVAREGFEGINFQGFANLETGIFKKLAPKWYADGIIRGRLMYPQAQPYYFLSGLGTQTDYVRGYEYYVIDGTNYGLCRLDLKREMFNNTWALPVKYFTAVPFRVYLKVFADAGYIQNMQPGNSFLSNRLLYSGGVGMDIVTLYDIKFRFEFAWNHLAQNGLFLHFNSE